MIAILAAGWMAGPLVQLGRAEITATGDVADVVEVRNLQQESRRYNRVWQPALERWDDRQLIVAYGAHYDGNIDMGDIYSCRSPDGGATWTESVPIFASHVVEGAPQYAYANPTLFHPRGQDIVWCIAMRCPRFYKSSSDSQICAAYTADGGRSWQPVELALDYHPPCLTCAPPIAVEVDGGTRYLLAMTRNSLSGWKGIPGYGDPRGDRCQLVLESTSLLDWKLAGYVPQEQPPKVFLHEGNLAPGDRPGEIKMVMRTATYADGTPLDPHVAYSSVSRDGGRTWSLAKPEPQLYNAACKGFYGRSSDGRHLYVYNSSPDRMGMSYVVQATDGTWSQPRVFYDKKVKNSYATLVEEKPGTFLCTWDSSNDGVRARTVIRFGRLRLAQP